MPIANRPLINSSNNDEHYKGIVNRQTKNDKKNNTFRNYASFSIGSTVAVWYEDGGLWIHGTVVER